MDDETDVAVVGGGQAGLATAWHLAARGIGHVVLERDRVGESWLTRRWDSLMFQFPNWSLDLPGRPWRGGDPDAFATHLQVAEVVQDYADAVRARGSRVLEGTDVTAVRPDADRGWRLTTGAGELRARAVVLATGPFQRAVLPPPAARLPDDLVQVHAQDYRRPQHLPDGTVLVVGSGGSGSQIAEELRLAGREVYLAVSPQRWAPRRRHGYDVLWWLREIGALDRPVTTLPRGVPPPGLLLTGVAGGHDMHLHHLAAIGVRLLGRLVDTERDELLFAGDLAAVAGAADEACKSLVQVIDEHARRAGMPLTDGPPVPATRSVGVDGSGRLRVRDLAAVVWCTGYRTEFDRVSADWLDDRGRPRQQRGVSEVPGLYVVGLHWMHTIASGLFFGVGADAEHVVRHLTDHLRR